MQTQLILTCEHAGNRVPAEYKPLFRGAEEVLASHRGWDPGALPLAKTFQRRLSAPLQYTTTTRLLVEPNRSVGHRSLFSEFTRPLERSDKQKILDRYYHPHRNQIESWIAGRVKKGGRVVHLSLHTFTPQWNGETRNADVGLLYDPGRLWEVDLCDAWHAALKGARPDLRIRRNYPYLGKADGFTTHLRRRFGLSYAGIELEVNQLWPSKPVAADWKRLRQDLAYSFAKALSQPASRL